MWAVDCITRNRHSDHFIVINLLILLIFYNVLLLTNEKILKEAKIENQQRKNWVKGKKMSKKVKDTTRMREKKSKTA